MRRVASLFAMAIIVLGLPSTVALAQGSRNAGIQPININPKGIGTTVGQNPNQNNNNAARAQQDLNRLNSMQRMLMPNALNQQQQLQQQQAGGAPGAMAGVLTGAERFLRENREPGSFVGAADPAEFIGANAEAMEIIAPPAEDLLPMQETLPDVLNTPAPAMPSAPQRPYEPRMVVGFDFAPPSSPAISVVLTDQLRALPGIDPANRIEVSVAMGIATLRGEAVSERDRALAERLLMFEPGISAVKNELKVRPLAAPTANPPAARPPAERSPSDRNFR